MRKVAVFFALGIIASQFGYGRAQAAGPANPPTSVAASTKDGTGTATIKWVAPAGATGYKVRAMIGLVTVKTAVIAGGSSTSYTFTGLEYKIPYTLSVKAGDGTGYATNYTDASSTVTLQAAPPSPPDQPLLDVTQDGAIDATWAPPSETGGSSIVSYSVQLWKKGEKFGDPKLPTTTATSFDTKGDTTSQFTITVQAVNAAGLVSLASDPSESIVAKKTATATTTTAAPKPNSGSGGDPTPTPGNDTTTSTAPKSSTPSATTTTSPSSSNSGNDPVTKPTVPPAAKEDQLTRIVSPVYAAPAISYTKTVSIKAKTTTKTLLTLSRLSVPKGSTTSYALSSTSKKYCSLKGTVVTAIKAGTCSITVTVKQQTGKKTSKVVKLVVKKRS
jgi:hypothetical protein